MIFDSLFDESSEGGGGGDGEGESENWMMGVGEGGRHQISQFMKSCCIIQNIHISLLGRIFLSFS